MSYKPIKRSESDSGSDYDQPTFDGDTEFLPRYMRLSRSKPWLSITVQVLVAVAATAITILVTLNLAILHSTLRQQRILNAQHSNNFADTLPTTYSHDRRFMTLDHQYDHLWNEWTSNAQIMVPGELPGEDMIQGAYSMFHQMHCLASMRRAIQIARAGEDPGFDYWEDGHWPHCFDYLRRSILCWADDTVEIAGVVEGERLPYIDGSRVLRQCRSPEHMYMRMRIDEMKVEKANREDGLEHEHEQGHHYRQDDYFNSTRTSTGQGDRKDPKY